LLAQDTAAFIQELGLSRSARIGSSDGGVTGLLLAIGWPGLLSCAVVCGSNTHPRKLKRWFYWAFRLGGMKPGQQTLRMVARQSDITPQQLASICTPVLVMAERIVKPSATGIELEILSILSVMEVKHLTRPGVQQRQVSF
jgi:pimeloyl-ACP methyl ester carboxylesterase